ncbi:hypothetical protein D9O31_26190 [Salmonella enterica]|uniref:Eaa protein n=1 Tax=Salmonella enterica TaxID=28901 RepID=A0A403T7X6_SALER|nr:hypothetical protein [Salmonella enterica]
MTTITRERLLKIKQWRETYGAGHNVTLPTQEAEELARIALDLLDAQPIAWTDEQELRDVAKDGCGYLFTVNPITPNADPRRVIKLYSTPPAPVVPVGLRMALSNAGIAAPESDEMLAATHEKYIQALVTWVKDRKPFQPAPVVPEECPEECPEEIRDLMASHSDALFNDDDAQEIWNACRAVMLQSQYLDLSQPVDPQISEYEKIMLRAGWVMVPVEPTDEMIAAAMECDDVVFDSKDPTAFCVQFREIYYAMMDAAPKPELTSE